MSKLSYEFLLSVRISHVYLMRQVYKGWKRRLYPHSLLIFWTPAKRGNTARRGFGT